jgi:hypothetical protein
MEQIPFNVVQNSIDLICGITEEKDLEKASEHFFDAQPELTSFFMEFIQDMSEGAQDLGFMMALILNKAFEDHYVTLRILTEDEIVEKFEKSESDFERYLNMTDELIEELQKAASAKGQPEILNYIIEELFMSPDLEPELEMNEQIHLFIICKFFVDCLNDLAIQTGPAQLKH